MKRVGILTAGGDTPALNATIFGAVTRACERRVEIYGLIKGFSSLFNPRTPHVRLNPLFVPIPELDATHGGTLIGASRDYVDANDTASLTLIAERLRRLGIEGLICVGGEGTLSGMQAMSDYIPTVLAPKTIDNDLGLNYRHEPDEWVREPADGPTGYRYVRCATNNRFDLDYMVNYATPGFATAVFVSSQGVQRIRTTAESHRRIAIIEVMGRHSGYLALGAAFGQPDIVLLPESPLDVDRLVQRVIEIYDLQKNVVIICGEGIVDANGVELGVNYSTTDPAGNKILSGAAEALRSLLIERLGDTYFTSKRRNESAGMAIFVRKVGHTQRGGRPLTFDRFYGSQLGGHALDLLVEGQVNGVAILQWSRQRGFYIDSVHANDFRDRYGAIRARQVHPSFYDSELLRPSLLGAEYLLPIFNDALGADDLEALRQNLFHPSNLTQPYHSVNVDMNKRIRYLE